MSDEDLWELKQEIESYAVQDEADVSLVSIFSLHCQLH